MFSCGHTHAEGFVFAKAADLESVLQLVVMSNRSNSKALLFGVTVEVINRL